MPDHTFLVAWFAFHQDRSQRKAFVLGARRDIEKMLFRSSGSGVSTMLRALVDGEFLDVKRSEKNTKAHRYGLASSMPVEERERWIELGKLLFPRWGFLGAFRTRPSRKHGHMMLNGLLILSILLKCGPHTGKEIKKTMAPIMVGSTTGRRLKFLTKNGFLQCKDGKYFATEDGIEAIAVYERRESLDTKAYAQKAKLTSQRLLFHQWNAGGPEMVQLKTDLQEGPCMECGKTPAGEVEHSPPQHWGGFDHPALMFSVCWIHNNDWSHIVRRVERPNYEKPVVFSLPKGTDVSQFAERCMSSARKMFYEGARRDDRELLELSKKRWESAWPLWYWENTTEEQSKKIHPPGYRRPAKPVVLMDWSMGDRFAGSVESSRKLARGERRRVRSRKPN